MKLHLPSGLRKALLACLAAFALPVTLSTGSAFLFGAACSISLAPSVFALYQTAGQEEWLEGQDNSGGDEVRIGAGSTLTIRVVDTSAAYNQSFEIQRGGVLELDNIGERNPEKPGDPSKGHSLTLSKDLRGSGSVIVRGNNFADSWTGKKNHPGVSLQGAAFEGSLTLDGAVVDLTGDMNVTGLSFVDSFQPYGSVDSDNKIRKSSSVEGSVDFSIYVAPGSSTRVDGDVTQIEDYQIASHAISFEEGVVFVKTGEGTLILGPEEESASHTDVFSVHDAEIRTGTLRVNGGVGAFSYSGRLSIGGTLVLTKTWGSNGDGVMELKNGAVVQMDVNQAATITINELEVSGQARLQWADAVDGRTAYVINRLTTPSASGASVLTVDPMTSAAAQGLEIREIANFNGVVECSAMGERADFRLGYYGIVDNVSARAGYVDQADGYDLTIKVGSGSLTATHFRKLGMGSLTIEGAGNAPGDIEVMQKLYMNYEGVLNYGALKLASSASLVYTTGDEDKVISVSYDEAVNTGSLGARELDLSWVENTHDLLDPEVGICLGIWTAEKDKATLDGYLENINLAIAGYNTSLLDCHYRWQEKGDRNYLWLSVELTDSAKVGRSWDPAWGLEILPAPNAEAMAKTGNWLGSNKNQANMGYHFANDMGDASDGKIDLGTRWDNHSNNERINATFFTKNGEEFASNVLQLAFSSALGLPSMPNSRFGVGDSYDYPHFLWEVDHTTIDGGKDGKSHRFAFTSPEGNMSAIQLGVMSVAWSGYTMADTATVLGGRLYTQEDAVDENYNNVKSAWFLEGWRSYISLEANQNTHYHLLVGGSSCVGSRDGADGSNGQALGGFQGMTHIQVGRYATNHWEDGGVVDYIVGGNHVNNSAFTFQGSTFISVMKGDVVGGIVGGSTLTKGAVNKDINVYAFYGSSNIYIYTPLRNFESGAPGISDGTTSASGIAGAAGKGAAFTAVVGGNAWIDVPGEATTQEMSPIFYGDSHITVSISADAVAGRQFNKDIVGGNYTAYTGSVSGSGNRNTVFEGDADISIKAPDSLTFTGMINGASRRSSGGAGITHFIGNTRVRITGGQYMNMIAGGMVFDESASGNHEARLLGNTVVELNSGTFWRAVGGFVSMGGDQNSSESQEGDSLVTIRGGEFRNLSGSIAQTGLPFVAGGDFYRYNQGGTGNDSDGNIHEGNAGVVILPSVDGAVFTDAHIVGGDYVNASAPEGVLVSNKVVSGINGESSVTIGALVNNEGRASVSGLVVGGSWLTDEGTSGTVSVADSRVTIYEGDVSRAELHPDNTNYGTGWDEHSGHYHLGVAVVGGNVLIDEDPDTDNSGAGDHKAEVRNATNITIGADGLTPTVSGHIIGGSYANKSKGANHLVSGDVAIEINSGNIDGNIYGGHYAESDSAADTQEIGSVTITMNGGSVKGSIVGGGYRAAMGTKKQDGSGLSTQGEIAIYLNSGQLMGDIYAAGWNAASAGAVSTTTESTLVCISDEFVIAPSTPEGRITISGGYGRVGVDLRRGTVNSARLEITGRNESMIAHSDSISLIEFSEVSIAAGMDLELNSDLIVLRSKDLDEQNSLTKDGAGTLAVNCLQLWNYGDNTLNAFSGRIILNDGCLRLAMEQNVSAGLTFDLATLAGHNSADAAYLQGNGGLLLDITGASKVDLSLRLDDASLLENLDFGTYYLATGLDERVADDVNFSGYSDSIDEFNAQLEAHGRYMQLRVIEGNLVLVVRDMADRRLFFWDGTKNNGTVWQDNSRATWRESNTNPAAPGPRGYNVYFDASTQGLGRVDLKSVVSPRSIWVQSGTYTFVGTEDAALNIGGADANYIDLGSDGSPLTQLAESQLAVGGEGRDAKLTLQVSAQKMSHALIKDRGTLRLDAADALLLGEAGTVVAFQGGVLEYGTDFTADLSSQVAKLGNGANDSNRLLRVGVAGSSPITWNATATGSNAGIDLALVKGVEKTGAGSFILEWATSAYDADVQGRIDVLGGALTYRMHATNNGGITWAADGGDIQVAAGANLTLEVEGTGNMRIDRVFAGSGRITLQKAAGSDNASQAPFDITVDNSAFTGTLVLAGNSSAGNADLVQVRDGASLGGQNSSLELRGLHPVMPSDYTARYTEPGEFDDPETFVSVRLADIDVKSIVVGAGTVNYVGGTAATPTGNGDLLITSEELTGSGALSTAWGNGTYAYRHTYRGDLTQFTGTIVAGDLRSKKATSSASTTSSWTLVDVGGGDLLANFAGGGTIIFLYDSPRATRLMGRIGDIEAGTGTSLENLSVGELVIADNPDAPHTNIATGAIITHDRDSKDRKVGLIRLGDNNSTGTWAGHEVRGDGAFVLTSGALVGGGITSKASDAKLIVETVVKASNNPNDSTWVDIGGTVGSMLDEITITAGGRLTGVGEDIHIGEGHSSAGRPINGVIASLTLGFDNIGDAPVPSEFNNYMIEMNGGNVILNDATSLTLDFTNEAFATVLNTMLAGDSLNESPVAWLHLVANGNLVIDESQYDELLALSQDSENGAAALLGILGFKVVGVDGGDLGISGRANEIYHVIRKDGELGEEGNDPTVPPVDSTGNGYGILSDYAGTLVDADRSLTINLTGKPSEKENAGEVSADALARDIAAGGAVVNNLIGSAGSVLQVNNVRLLELGEAKPDTDDDLDDDWDDDLEEDEIIEDTGIDLSNPANRVSVVFNNSASPFAEIGSDEAKAAQGISTTFEGTITATAGVDMVKAGKGTLTIGAADGSGGLLLAEGDVRIIGGGLTLRADENEVRSITFAYTDPISDIYEPRALTLDGAHASVDSIVEDGGKTLDRKGADIVLANGAKLSLTGDSYLMDSIFMQGEGDTGTLSIEKSARLTLGALLDPEADPVRKAAVDENGEVIDQLKGINLCINNGGVLDMALSRGTVNNLSGSGTLTGSGGTLPGSGTLFIAGSGPGVFSGTLEGVGALHVMEGGVLSFTDAVGGDAWSVDNYGTLNIDLKSNQRDRTLLGDVTLHNGSTTRFIINTDVENDDRSLVQAASLTVENGSKVEVTSSGKQIITDAELTLATVKWVPSRSDVQNAQVTLSGLAFLHFKKSTSLYMRGNDVMVGLEASEGNEFISSGMHKNAFAGAVLFWEATDTATNAEWARIAKDAESDLYKMALALSSMYDKKQTAALHRTLAAGAGASVSVLGSAISQDVERQLRSIRNRTTTMGSESRFDGNDQLPLYHMWISGESSYHKMSADGLAPGYSLSNWGGSVGMDADVSSNATVGLAVSAMYGDLKADAADNSRGDTTTTYLSGFARVSSGSWMHTFVVTAGLSDVKLDRTVNYGDGHYTTRGHTNGYQLGALYEVGYSRALNMRGTSVLQGVANVEVRHASLGSYDELNTEAGLHVDSISHTVLTFGVGARLQAIVAENALNRASIFEARALVKADAGDRSGTATTSLIHGSAARQEVESAELGVLGLEVGAGFTVPMGRKGVFFIDASAELRSGYTEFDASVGYRLSF